MYESVGLLDIISYIISQGFVINYFITKCSGSVITEQAHVISERVLPTRSQFLSSLYIRAPNT